MSKLVRLLLSLLLAGSVLAACGGDDDDVDANVDIEADVDLDDITEDLGEFASEDCIEAASAFFAAVGGAASAFTGEAEELEESLEQLADYVDDVPGEIKADFETVVDAYTEFVEAYGEIGFDASSGEMPSEEQLAALEEVGRMFEDSDVEEASDNINAWFEENCGTDG